MQDRKATLMFRVAGYREVRRVHSFISSIGKCTASNVIGELTLYALYGGPFIEVFALNEWQQKISALLSRKNMHPYSIGLHVGRINKSGIKPSIPLARRFMETCGLENVNYVILDMGAEKKFLYGRDLVVTPGSVHLSSTQNLHVVVVNAEKDVLGWGFISDIGKGKIKLMNVIDVGWYLRGGG